MPKYLRTFLAASAAACAVAPALPAQAASAADDKAIYDRIAALAGDWSGHMEDPLAGPPVTVRFEVVSGGHAVIEHQHPAGSMASVTVYFLADGKLRAVQYSPAGNQPAYKLGGGSKAGLAQFEFDGGTGFDADHDGHVHKGDIRFVAPDRIEQRWFHYVGPKEQGVTHWFLERAKPADAKAEPAPAAAPKETKPAPAPAAPPKDAKPPPKDPKPAAAPQDQKGEPAPAGSKR